MPTLARFDETKHPRARAGRFADKPGAGDDAPASPAVDPAAADALKSRAAAMKREAQDGPADPADFRARAESLRREAAGLTRESAAAGANPERAALAETGRRLAGELTDDHLARELAPPAGEGRDALPALKRAAGVWGTAEGARLYLRSYGDAAADAVEIARMDTVKLRAEHAMGGAMGKVAAGLPDPPVTGEAMTPKNYRRALVVDSHEIPPAMRAGAADLAAKGTPLDAGPLRGGFAVVKAEGPAARAFRLVEDNGGPRVGERVRESLDSDDLNARLWGASRAEEEDGPGGRQVKRIGPGAVLVRRRDGTVRVKAGGGETP